MNIVLAICTILVEADDETFSARISYANTHILSLAQRVIVMNHIYRRLSL